MPLDLALEPALAASIETLSGARLDAARRVSGGRNARVWQVETSRGCFAVKHYASVGPDGRDRFATETRALAFLNRHGVESVPELLAGDTAHRLALFRWVEGEPALPPRPTDMAQALDLAQRLHDLCAAADAHSLPLASEACLSGAELVAQIARRIARMQEVTDGGAAFDRLIGDTVPARLAAAEQALAGTIDVAEILPQAARTLSPSDFGLHNAVRPLDGRLVFLDFEYFGWDDPVKLVADFLLHPGMTLDAPCRASFHAGAARLYGGDARFGTRLRGFVPLYVLRWTLILLNEFLPERLALRRASGLAGERSAILAEQLAKAETMLCNPVPTEL